MIRARLEGAGIALIACTLDGEVARGGENLINGQWPVVDSDSCQLTIPNSPKSTHGVQWIADLMLTSPLFRKCMKEAAALWSLDQEPSPVLAFQGVWLIPSPVLRRRRRTGYLVAITVTDDVLEAEQLAAVCQSAQMDFELCTRKLRSIIDGVWQQSDTGVPECPPEIARAASLVKGAIEDERRAAADAQSLEAIGKQLSDSYEEMNLLYTITQNMTVQERPERFIAQACHELLATLPYAWIGLQLADDRERLSAIAGQLILAGDAGQSGGTVRAVAQSLLKSANPDSPMVLEPATNLRHAAFAALGCSALVQPVVDPRDRTVLALLIAGEKRGPDPSASNIDIKLLGATATHMAIFLENAALYSDLNAMFLGTLEALTASIDAKDRYTCGHSRRVAHLTQLLARQIGLDEQTVSRCHIAGLVHDVGKIGVPEHVLLKPGRLTEEEFGWIRKHPEIGYRILKDIPQLKDILPGVLYHHERWDGRGYPQGLAGEAIPLVARLIGLADSFDAMSSNRTYRAAMTRERVLAEIERCAAGQFDPELAQSFLSMNFDEYDRMTREHQQQEAAGSVHAAGYIMPSAKEKAA